MKAATLLTLASTAFVLVSAAPSEAIKRSPEPEPEPEPVPEPDLMTGGSPLDGVMCGLSGYPRVNIPDLATNQASNGFLGELQSKTGSINGGEGPNACTQVSCANGVAVSFCNDVSDYGLNDAINADFVVIPCFGSVLHHLEVCVRHQRCVL
jgi:hypothetical protein